MRHDQQDRNDRSRTLHRSGLTVRPKAVGATASLLVALAAGVAAAQAPAPVPVTVVPPAAPVPAPAPVPWYSGAAPAAVPEPRTRRQPMPTATAAALSQAPAPIGLFASVGGRTDLVRGAGLDAFSTTDALAQTALSVGYRWGQDDQSGLGAGLEWDHGDATANSRAARASLTVDRLSIGLEGRLPLVRRLVAFARLAPALLRLRATASDGSTPPPPYGGQAPATLAQTSWVPGGDLSGGLAVRLADWRGPRTPLLSFWLLGEGGYGYSASRDLALRADGGGQAARTDEPVHLGSLALRGPFIRLWMALSL